eukprot:scaffold1913_cov151-Skeletonema_dohrnii-CCMP3373.AAC.4
MKTESSILVDPIRLPLRRHGVGYRCFASSLCQTVPKGALAKVSPSPSFNSLRLGLDFQVSVSGSSPIGAAYTGFVSKSKISLRGIIPRKISLMCMLDALFQGQGRSRAGYRKSRPSGEVRGRDTSGEEILFRKAGCKEYDSSFRKRMTKAQLAHLYLTLESGVFDLFEDSCLL